MKQVIFIQYTAEVGGSPISGLTLVDLLRNAGVDIDTVFGVAGPLQVEYERRGCVIHSIAHGQWLVGGSLIRRARRWPRELRSAFHFLRLFRRKSPDLVYVNTLMGVSAVAAARVLRVPVVWHIREQFVDVGGEMHWPFGGRPVVRALVRRLPTRIVCIAKAVQDNVLGAAPCRKVTVIPNSLDPSAFETPCDRAEARDRLGLPADGFIIGVPGTLRPVKGHEFFLDAASRLAARYPDAVFAITGDWDHPFGHDLRVKAEDLGIGEQVRFLGTVADMRPFYSACDIVCVPSRAEPFGRTVIEAFAQRRAVVATRVGGIRETVAEGETGLLVDYRDVAGLAGSLEQLREDHALGGRLADAAYCVAWEWYRTESVQQQLAEVITAATGQVFPESQEGRGVVQPEAPEEKVLR